MRHFRSMLDVSPEETLELIDGAIRMKRDRAQGENGGPLARRVLGLLFEKPSLRTRVSFEAAFAHLGGHSIFMTGAEIGIGTRECIGDIGRVMSTYVDLLAVRTFSHDVIVELAANSACPIINALSDFVHPCQSLADLLTIREHFGRIEGVRVAYVGDGNNVARSLALASAYTGIDFVLSAPAGYELTDAFLTLCCRPGMAGTVQQEPDPRRAVENADVVYTDVWASMGQEDEQDERSVAFANYQVNADLMSIANPTAKFMHCLPAHRGQEVTDEVIDGPQSIVIDQAANRLHAQKSLMLWLLTGRT